MGFWRRGRARHTPVTRGAWVHGVALVALAVALASCADNDLDAPLGQGEDTDRPVADAECGTPADFASVAPPEVQAAADQWPVAGQNYAGTREAISRIDQSNFEDLEVAWRYELPPSPNYSSAATTPLVLGDTVYLQDLNANIYAIDAATGEERWVYQDGSVQVGPSGVAVGYGIVAAPKGTKGIVALDADTGQELWTTELARTATEGVGIQPLMAAGMVFASTVPVSIEGIFTGGDQGIIHALDAKTGKIVWSFNTVEEGLWGNPAINSGGGAWYTPTLDADRGRIAFGTGNPAPFPGTPEFPNGSSRPGENLYTDSLVALDIQTGELCWYHQPTPHDLLDRDYVHTMLVDTPSGEGSPAGAEPVGARPIGASNSGTPSGQVEIGTGKLGRVLGYDPDTGAKLWDTPVGTHRNDDLDSLSGPTEVFPGVFGGVISPPSAADGVVYVAAINAPSVLPPDQPSYSPPKLGTENGEVAAIDARTGKELWATSVKGDPFGGTVVVNDLVLTGTFQGKIYAFDRADGSIRAEIEPGGGINAWPAVVEDTIYWPIAAGDAPALVAYRLPEG
jgi:glucose dehydrogenase